MSILSCNITSAVRRVAAAIAVSSCVFALGCSRSEEGASAAKLDGTEPNVPDIVDDSPEEPAPRPVVDRMKLPRERGVTIEHDDVMIQLDDAIVTHGDQGQAIIDKQTGKYLYPAMTCTSPDCPSHTASQPVIFVNAFPIANVDRQGYVVMRKGTPPARAVAKCPVCRQSDGVRLFLLPEEAKRQTDLDRELAAARDAFRATGALPTSMRPPEEIFRDALKQD